MLTSKSRFVVGFTGENKDEVLFTDYDRPQEQSNFYNEVTIWQAARATSAATTFFDPMRITSGSVTRVYLDGAFAANNPVESLYIEAGKQWPGQPISQQICCLVSIGTGRPSLKSFGETAIEIAKSIEEIATQTQQTHARFYHTHPELTLRNAYYRFNPPYMDEVGVVEAKKKGLISARTEAYGKEPEVEARVTLFGVIVGQEQSASMLASLERQEFA